MRIVTRVATRALVVGAIALSGAPALAQTQSPAGTPARIAGTVEKLAGQTLEIRTQGGQDVSIALPPGVRIGAVANRTLADIKPGDFVGSAAVRDMHGVLHAQEVHIFPESMRGTGEGHRPMAGPEQSMTNAVVTGIAGAPEGHVLTLKYQSGEQKIEVGSEARIVALVPGDRSLLKPGAAVVVRAVKAEDGKLTARSVQAEKDGVKPLM
ncbi:MAG: hypothetical protein J0H14_18840 [Alphaproteobacteria bacterium]|nr:hypothetical protein [Alphaproteobacteria bacterium]